MKPWRTRLSSEQSRRLMEHFVAGTPARTAAQLVGVNRNTARLFYHRVRELISEHLAEESPFQGPLQVEESVLAQAPPDPQRRPVRRQPVFALLKRGAKVYTAMVLDAPPEAAEAKAPLRPDSIVYTDPSATRASVLDVSRFQHRRVQPHTAESAEAHHIDEIENFWSQAKRRMRRYNGIPRRHFHLFLKECEWRFNYGTPRQLLDHLKHWSRRRPQ